MALSTAVADTLLHFHGDKSAEIASELAALYEAARDYARAALHCRVAAHHASRLSASQEALVGDGRGLGPRGNAGDDRRARLETELGL